MRFIHRSPVLLGPHPPTPRLDPGGSWELIWQPLNWPPLKRIQSQELWELCFSRSAGPGAPLVSLSLSLSRLKSYAIWRLTDSAILASLAFLFIAGTIVVKSLFFSGSLVVRVL
ncbi:hypothetical protein F2P79_022846 [Pimephales promelas]|nr:hypothetical protein F2P79_022846 [Pimephales promelas]